VENGPKNSQIRWKLAKLKLGNANKVRSMQVASNQWIKTIENAPIREIDLRQIFLVFSKFMKENFGEKDGVW
jgi:hypothetical protein